MPFQNLPELHLPNKSLNRAKEKSLTRKKMSVKIDRLENEHRTTIPIHTFFPSTDAPIAGN